MFATNPAMCAYAETGGDLEVLVSLGTGEHTRPLPYEQVKDWGRLEWARPVLDVVFDGTADAVDFQLESLLGAGYVRLQTRSTRPATSSTTPRPRTWPRSSARRKG